jgi:hypothetical protein
VREQHKGKAWRNFVRDSAHFIRRTQMKLFLVLLAMIAVAWLGTVLGHMADRRAKALTPIQYEQLTP